MGGGGGRGGQRPSPASQSSGICRWKPKPGRHGAWGGVWGERHWAPAAGFVGNRAAACKPYAARAEGDGRSHDDLGSTVEGQHPVPKPAQPDRRDEVPLRTMSGQATRSRLTPSAPRRHLAAGPSQPQTRGQVCCPPQRTHAAETCEQIPGHQAAWDPKRTPCARFLVPAPRWQTPGEACPPWRRCRTEVCLFLPRHRNTENNWTGFHTSSRQNTGFRKGPRACFLQTLLRRGP